jgi:alpha-tubulin suppressor-like RCC1 family protein
MEKSEFRCLEEKDFAGQKPVFRAIATGSEHLMVQDQEGCLWVRGSSAQGQSGIPALDSPSASVLRKILG